MKFNEQVNTYIEELNCTAKELADASGLSAAVISCADADKGMQNTSVLDELNLLSEEGFAQHPVHLALAGAFYETDISYTYDEYLNHISLTKDFAEAHPTYTLHDSVTQVFRNIQIHILEG